MNVNYVLVKINAKFNTHGVYSLQIQVFQHTVQCHIQSLGQEGLWLHIIPDNPMLSEVVLEDQHRLYFHYSLWGVVDHPSQYPVDVSCLHPINCMEKLFISIQLNYQNGKL